MDKDPREPGLPVVKYFDEAEGFLTSGATSKIVIARQGGESPVTLALRETEEKVGIT